MGTLSLALSPQAGREGKRSPKGGCWAAFTSLPHEWGGRENRLIGKSGLRLGLRWKHYFCLTPIAEALCGRWMWTGQIAGSSNAEKFIR